MNKHLLTVLLCQCALTAHGHGRLTKPLSRGGPGYENDPVPGHTSDAFVCRHTASKAGVETTTLTAGSEVALQWDFSAAHVGDCAVFLTYDVDKPLKEQKYFKIANLFRCREQNRQDVTITVPAFVPPGTAILRWDWYALHQHPGVEFYSQCVDVNVVSQSTNTPADFTSYSIVDPPIYPANGRMGVGYRNPFNRNSDQFMTGPACAGPVDDPAYAKNQCDLTAKGTAGYTGGGGEEIGGEAKIGTTAAPGSTPEELEPTCEIYTVVAGDTMSKIAETYTAQGKEVTFQHICQANGKLDTCDIIDVNDDYIIPYKGSPCEFMGSNTTQAPQNQGQIAARSFTASLSTTVLAACTFALSSMK